MDYQYAGYGLTMAFDRMPCDVNSIALGSPSVIFSRYDGPTAFTMQTEGFFASRVRSNSAFTVSIDDGERCQFADEALMIVGPGRRVSCDFTGPLEGQFISMSPEAIAATTGAACAIPTSIHGPDEDIVAWHLVRAVAASVTNNKTVDPLVYQSIADAMLRLVATRVIEVKRMPTLSVQQACAVRAMIVDGLGGELRIGDLARSLNLSAGHFARAFKESFGASPYNYILRERATLAQRLIVEGDLSLAAVAERAGFCNRAQMTRALKTHLGQTARAARAATSRAKVRSPTFTSDVPRADETRLRSDDLA